MEIRTKRRNKRFPNLFATSCRHCPNYKPTFRHLLADCEYTKTIIVKLIPFILNERSQLSLQTILDTTGKNNLQIILELITVMELFRQQFIEERIQTEVVNTIISNFTIYKTSRYQLST